MESIKKLMAEIQTNNDDFNVDKFACTQEVFDLIRKLPNFKPADPTVPESGYLNGKPIYVHPACVPNTLMGLKNQEVPAPEVYMCPIDFQSNLKNFTDFYGDMTYETKDCRKSRLHNKPNTRKVIEVLAEIISPIVLALLIVLAAVLFVILTI